MPNSIVELFNRCHQLDRVEQQKVIEKLRLDDPKMADELDALLKAEPTQFGIPAKPDDHQSSSFQIPQVIDEYRVEGILGVGGMGMVLQGHRADIDLSVAIKVAHQSNTSKTTKIALEQEAKILASLEHPNIASIKDWGTIDNFGHFIATEFIRGKTIRQYCEDENLSIKAIIQLFLKVISAVSHAHSRLVLHRDIKPSNIMVTDQGEPKLIDFGVAKVMTSIHESEEQTLSAGLTPSYASPEQLAGKPLSIRSDVYSLGLVLITLLCDEVVPQHTAHQIKDALLKQKKEKPQSYRTISKQNCQELALVLAKACHEDAEQRYENTQALSRDLTAILNQKPIEARAPGVIYKIRKFIIRNKWATAISGAALALAFIGIGFGSWYWVQSEKQRELTETTNNELRSYSNFLKETINGLNSFVGGSSKVTMEEFLSRSVEILKKEKSVSEYRLAIHAHLLSQVYNSWGNYKQALDILNHGLSLAKSSLPLDDDIILLAEKVIVLNNLYKFQSCIETGEEALNIIGSDDSHKKLKIKLYTNLSNCYSGLGLSEKSLDYIDKIISSPYASESDIAYSSYSAAFTYFDLMEYDKGIENAERGLEFFVKEYGENSGMAIACEYILLNLKGHSNPLFFNESEEANIIKKFNILFKEDHPNQAAVLTSIAALYFLKGNIAKAIEVQKKAQEKYKNISQDESLKNKVTIYLAKYLFHNGQINIAKSELEKIPNVQIVSGKLLPSDKALYYLLLASINLSKERWSEVKKLLDIVNQIQNIEKEYAISLLYKKAQLDSVNQDFLSCHHNSQKAYQKAKELFPKTWQLPDVYHYLADVCQLKLEGKQPDDNSFPYLQALLDSPWKQEAVLTTKILNAE